MSLPTRTSRLTLQSTGHAPASRVMPFISNVRRPKTTVTTFQLRDTQTKTVNIAFALFVGLALWLPTLLALSGGGLGPAMGGTDLLPVWSPFIFVTVPAFVRAIEHRPSTAVWLIASAPLLMIAGFIGGQVLRRVLFEGKYSPSGDLLCHLLATLPWLLLGAIHVVQARRAKQSHANRDA